MGPGMRNYFGLANHTRSDQIVFLQRRAVRFGEGFKGFGGLVDGLRLDCLDDSGAVFFDGGAGGKLFAYFFQFANVRQQNIGGNLQTGSGWPDFHLILYKIKFPVDLSQPAFQLNELIAGAGISLQSGFPVLVLLVQCFNVFRGLQDRIIIAVFQHQ